MEEDEETPKKLQRSLPVIKELRSKVVILRESLSEYDDAVNVDYCTQSKKVRIKVKEGQAPM